MDTIYTTVIGQTFFPVITEQEKSSIMDEIICGKELKFNYINGDKLIKLLDSKNIPKNDIIYLDILKYNYNHIFLQIANYFPNIEVNKFYDSPCVNECANFHIDTVYRYGLYLILKKKDKIFEYGFDFFSSIFENQENKYEHSKTLLDHYEYFYSDDIKSNEDIKKYLDETVFKLIISIYTIYDDEYKLAEILFTRIYKDKMETKLFIKELGYFTRIIEWKKSNEINLDELFDSLQLVDNKTEKEITLNSFKKIIKTLCDKWDIKFDIGQKFINFRIFEVFLLNNFDLSSRTLIFYKKSYQQSMDILMQSLKLIIQLTNEMNMRKKFFSKYINFLIEFKLGDYINQKIFDKIYLERINNKKELFEKLFNQINIYCEKNKHNENALNKIKNNFDSLYDDMFNV